MPDVDITVGEARYDLQLPAHGLDEAPERADIHVGPLFQLGDCRLLDMQDLPEGRLGQRSRLAQLRQIHFLAQRLGDPPDARLALARHLGHQP